MELIGANRILFDTNVEYRKRLDAMTQLLDDAIAVMDKYVNAPEVHEIKKRWEALKNP